MRRRRLLGGLFGIMLFVGILVAGCGGVNVHMATPGQGDNLMTADQEIYYGHMMGDTFNAPKPQAAQLGTFPNTKWQILSVVPKPNTPFKSVILTFQTDSTLVMTTESPDGKISTSFQRYSVVGDSMLLSKPGSTTNVKFRTDGNTMHVDTSKFSIVLERVN
jgi:hypothetical protein